MALKNSEIPKSTIEARPWHVTHKICALASYRTSFRKDHHNSNPGTFVDAFFQQQHITANMGRLHSNGKGTTTFMKM